MNRRAGVAGVVLLAMVSGACSDSARAGGTANRKTPAPTADQRNEANLRRVLLEELKPVTLQNCTMKRFGSVNDGGYVMCENLLQDVKAAYSYGIGDNDDWGCEVSTRLKVPVHQYDCFEPPNLTCSGGQFVPHNECVGPVAESKEGRKYDTIQNQIARNGDGGRRLLVKMDVEGAEWKSLLATPDEVLATIDQLPMELHGTGNLQYLEAVQKLKTHFYIVHLHFNNWACQPNLAPFPANAFQVLLVNKRIAVPGPPPPGAAPARQFDAPDNPKGADCQLPVP
jgi:hypothetical protein